MNRAFEHLRVDDQGPVRTVAIHRPDRRNAISPVTANELIWALDDARDDDDVRVIVLTGSEGFFSAGGDLGDMASGDSGLAQRGGFADLLLRFGSLGKPTIARVNGHAYGGALGLIASTDFAVASEDAKLGTPEIRRGLFPMMIMAPLARVVPRRRLLEMMLTGRSLCGREALDAGLVTHVVPAGALDDQVTALADALAMGSPTAMRRGLAAFHRWAEAPLSEALPALEQELFSLLSTEDAQEGLRAFLEKREPRWQRSDGEG